MHACVVRVDDSLGTRFDPEDVERLLRSYNVLPK